MPEGIIPPCQFDGIPQLPPAVADVFQSALVAQFGQGVLALPGDDGDRDLDDVLVYLIAALALLLALGGIAFAVVPCWRLQVHLRSTGVQVSEM